MQLDEARDLRDTRKDTKHEHGMPSIVLVCARRSKDTVSQCVSGFSESRAFVVL